MEEKFSKPIVADADAFYMSCPEAVGRHLAEQLSNFSTAVDLCCAVGMLAIQLAKKLDKVYGVDINQSRIEAARINARLYGVETKTNFIVGDALNQEVLKNFVAEVAVLDPDWSAQGAEKTAHVNNLDETQPSLRKMFGLTNIFVTSNIVCRIPKNFTFDTLSGLGPCRIENIIWNGQVKFKIAYFLKTITHNNESDYVLDKN